MNKISYDELPERIRALTQVRAMILVTYNFEAGTFNILEFKPRWWAVWPIRPIDGGRWGVYLMTRPYFSLRFLFGGRGLVIGARDDYIATSIAD